MEVRLKDVMESQQKQELVHLYSIQNGVNGVAAVTNVEREFKKELVRVKMIKEKTFYLKREIVLDVRSHAVKVS